VFSGPPRFCAFAPLLCASTHDTHSPRDTRQFYLSKQDQYAVPSDEEVKREEAEILRKEEALVQLREQQKKLRSACDSASARQTDAELQEELASLRTETKELEAKVLASKTGESKLTLKDVQRLEDTARARISEWKTRKRAAKEIVEKIAEAQTSKVCAALSRSMLPLPPLLQPTRSRTARLSRTATPRYLQRDWHGRGSGLPRRHQGRQHLLR